MGWVFLLLGTIGSLATIVAPFLVPGGVEIWDQSYSLTHVTAAAGTLTLFSGVAARVLESKEAKRRHDQLIAAVSRGAPPPEAARPGPSVISWSLYAVVLLLLALWLIERLGGTKGPIPADVEVPGPPETGFAFMVFPIWLPYLAAGVAMLGAMIALVVRRLALRKPPS